jgi:hypothetical protein
MIASSDLNEIIASLFLIIFSQRSAADEKYTFAVWEATAEGIDGIGDDGEGCPGGGGAAAQQQPTLQLVISDKLLAEMLREQGFVACSLWLDR